MKRLLMTLLAGLCCLRPCTGWATMILQAFSPALHNRFHDPVDPAKAFIGDPFDWSGVGRGSHWATMISPSYFLSATHSRPTNGEMLYFYKTNDPAGPVEIHTAESGVQIGQTDIWLGKLSTPVSSDVAKYPILLLPQAALYDNLEIATFGLSNTAPSQTNVRLGRNNIDPGRFFDTTDGGGRRGWSYQYDFDNPGGLGADESYLQVGDSGGPSFAIADGFPAIVGLHWYIAAPPEQISGDSFVGPYVDDIREAMGGEPLVVVPEPSLTWDELGAGNWNSDRWLGAPPAVPDSTTRAVVQTNEVAITAEAAAYSLLVKNDGWLVVDAGALLNVTARAEIVGGTLEVTPGGTVRVGGKLTLDSFAQYVTAVGPAGSGEVSVTGNVALSPDSTLALWAAGSLTAVGDATHTVLTTARPTGLTGSLTPAQAAGDHLGYGVFVTDQGANHQAVSFTANAINVDLFQAAPGDINGDRQVDSNDIQAILAAAKFNTGPSAAEWPEGDFDSDQDVDSDDIQAVLATGLFNNGPYAALLPPIDQKPAVDLAITPAGLLLDTHGVSVNGYIIQSEQGVFTGEAARNLGLFQEDGDHRIAGNFFFSLVGTHVLGRVIGGEFAGVDLRRDLMFTYTLEGEPGIFQGAVVVPEPGAVALLAGLAVGLLVALLRRVKTNT